VNRFDVCARYCEPDERANVVTRHMDVSPGLLRAHFEARRRCHLLIPLSLDAGGMGKTADLDIDSHAGEGESQPDPDKNLDYAFVLYDRAVTLGFHPLLYTSDGVGGYHLRVLFSGPVAGSELRSFALWLAFDHTRDGVTQIEVFPKQVRVSEENPGNGLRLIGRHHTRKHWPWVWNGSEWLEGDAAVDHVLSLTGDSPDLIPDGIVVPLDPEPHPEPATPATGTIAGGTRNTTLTSLAGSMRQRGMGREAIEAALLAENKARCDPPLPEGEVRGIAASISKYPSGGGKAKAPSVADVIAGIGLERALWHDSTQTGFVTVDRRTYKVRSKAFRSYLTNQYRTRTGKTPNSESLSNAINAIDAAAVHDGQEHTAHVRVAGHDGKVYLHLADSDDTVIEIDGDGWWACDDPPVKFWRPSGMLPLPMPEPGGNLDELRGFLNVPDDGTFALIKASVSGWLSPDGPYPALVLLGEKGSAKTTTARVVKALIDPAAAPVRSEPRDARDLIIGARNNRVLVLDNLSHLPGWLSDALCRLSTGGGFSTRTLYTDDDEFIFEAQRPAVLTGITDFVTRGDLLDRSILVRHPPITEEARRPESEFWAEFGAAHAKLLGALLDRVSAGLRELPGVTLDRLPRMATFARFAVACERGSGEDPVFLSAYADNQSGANEQALDAFPLIVDILLGFMDGSPPDAATPRGERREQWVGKPTELFRLPTAEVAEERLKDWPKTPPP
jgi:hypothetical protein